MIKRKQSAGWASPGQPAAFDPAELPADRVQLGDVRPGGAQMPGDGQFVGQRNARRSAPATRPTRRPEIRHEAKIVAAKAAHDPQNFFCPGDSLGRRFVDAGGPGRMQTNACQRPHAIGRHIDPAADLLFDSSTRWPSARSRPAAMPAPALPAPTMAMRPIASRSMHLVADQQPAALDLHVLGDQASGIDRVDAGPPDGQGVGAQSASGALHRINPRRASDGEAAVRRCSRPLEQCSRAGTAELAAGPI